MKDDQDYEVAEELPAISKEQQLRKDVGHVEGGNQYVALGNKVVDAITVYHNTQRDIIESVEKTNRHKNQLDAEVYIISADIEKQRAKNDNEHKELMQDMSMVGQLVDDAIETNDKDKFKMVVDLFKTKYTGKMNQRDSDIDWNSNDNKLDF